MTSQDADTASISLADAAAAFNREPSPSSAVDLAEAQLRAGQLDEGLATLRDASVSYPRNKKVHRRLVQVARSLGEFDVWAVALERLTELLPEDPGLWMQRSVAANQTADAFLYWRSLERATELFRERALDGNVNAFAGYLRAVTRAGRRDDVQRLTSIMIAEADKRPTNVSVRAAADALVWAADLPGLADLAERVAHIGPEHEAAAEVADLLIRTERNDDARAMIDALAATGRKADELRAWAAATRGEVALARSIVEPWNFPHTLQNVRVLDDSRPINLEPVGTVPSPSGFENRLSAVLICKDELRRLDDWFDHHRRLGVAHVYAIDNASTDGTREWLLEQPDVTVFDARGDFRQFASGRRWVNELLGRHLGENWAAVLDADEYLAFPDDHLGADELVRRLDAEGADIVFGVALDMHGERLHEWDHDTDMPLVDRFPWFEGATAIVGNRQSPHLAVAGGLRNRKLATVMPENLLTKSLILRAGQGTIFANPHITNPARSSATTAAVLHYKFAVDPRHRQGIPTAKGVYMQLMGHDVEALRSLELVDESSVRFRDSAQLVELGLMRRGGATRPQR